MLAETHTEREVRRRVVKVERGAMVKFGEDYGRLARYGVGRSRSKPRDSTR